MKKSKFSYYKDRFEGIFIITSDPCNKKIIANILNLVYHQDSK
jgi:hypothetical protein